MMTTRRRDVVAEKQMVWLRRYALPTSTMLVLIARATSADYLFSIEIRRYEKMKDWTS